LDRWIFTFLHVPTHPALVYSSHSTVGSCFAELHLPTWVYLFALRLLRIIALPLFALRAHRKRLQTFGRVLWFSSGWFVLDAVCAVCNAHNASSLKPALSPRSRHIVLFNAHAPAPHCSPLSSFSLRRFHYSRVASARFWVGRFAFATCAFGVLPCLQHLRIATSVATVCLGLHVCCAVAPLSPPLRAGSCSLLPRHPPTTFLRVSILTCIQFSYHGAAGRTARLPPAPSLFPLPSAGSSPWILPVLVAFDGEWLADGGNGFAHWVLWFGFSRFPSRHGFAWFSWRDISSRGTGFLRRWQATRRAGGLGGGGRATAAALSVRRQFNSCFLPFAVLALRFTVAFVARFTHVRVRFRSTQFSFYVHVGRCRCSFPFTCSFFVVLRYLFDRCCC